MHQHIVSIEKFIELECNLSNINRNTDFDIMQDENETMSSQSSKDFMMKE